MAGAAVLHASHPAWLLATWFGTGRLPGIPGTWGSLAALPFALALAWLGGPWLVLGAAAALFGLGVWATRRYVTAFTAGAAWVLLDDVVAGTYAGASALAVLALLP